MEEPTMSPMRLKALNDVARTEQPTAADYVAVAFDDDGAEVFRGRIEYADGGYFGIRNADGEVTEWPAELVHMQDAA
jgi:hypothetical protein